jgi:hypothetical protein
MTLQTKRNQDGLRMIPLTAEADERNFPYLHFQLSRDLRVWEWKLLREGRARGGRSQDTFGSSCSTPELGPPRRHADAIK